MGRIDRRVQLVLLCEDTQHETLIRRFLEREGWSTRRLRVERAPGGRGAAVQFVRQRFPDELAAYRSTRGAVEQALIVVLDGDRHGVEGREAQLNEACLSRGLPVRQPDERVIVLVPTWNVETWLAYLDDQTVDEGRADYPRLPRPRQCRRHVDALADMCGRGRLRKPAPPALESACTEYGRLRRTS